MRILFVENHEVFAAVVGEKFLAAHEVVVVPSLAGARASLAAQRYDAILLDFDLDDGKGVELAVELRAAGDATPIIAVSAREDGNQKLITAGANAAVSKLEFGKIGTVLSSLVSGLGPSPARA